MNPAAGDLYLKPGALAVIDRIATPPANAGRDWDGHPRPAAATDVGADEHGGSTVTRPSAPRNFRIIR